MTDSSKRAKDLQASLSNCCRISGDGMPLIKMEVVDLQRLVSGDFNLHLRTHSVLIDRRREEKN